MHYSRKYEIFDFLVDYTAESRTYRGDVVSRSISWLCITKPWSLAPSSKKQDVRIGPCSTFDLSSPIFSPKMAPFHGWLFHPEVRSEPPLKAFIIRFLLIYHLPFLKYKCLFFIFEVANISNIHLVFYLVGKFNIGIWVFSLWLLLDIVPRYIYGIIIHYNYLLNISNIFSDSILFWIRFQDFHCSWYRKSFYLIRKGIP